MQGDQIKAAELSSKSGRITLNSRIFIDTSGDADLAYLSGAPCLQGRDGDKLTQPMTMKFRMRGVDLARVKEYMLTHPDEFYEKTPFSELAQLPLSGVMGFYKHWHDADLPIPRKEILFFTGPAEDEVLINSTRVQGLNGTDVEDLTLAEEQGRKQVLLLAEFMTRQLPGFERAAISQVGSQISIRETRRIAGQYTLEAQEVIAGRRFEDVIARSGYPIDIHAPTGQGDQDKSVWVAGDGTYDIPYCCLLPQKISNLLVAGRCISTSHEALATTRLSPSCMATGQAAGAAAGIALKQGKTPAEINTRQLQTILLKQEALLELD